jgi:hypothetical protein
LIEALRTLHAAHWCPAPPSALVSHANSRGEPPGPFSLGGGRIEGQSGSSSAVSAVLCCLSVCWLGWRSDFPRPNYTLRTQYVPCPGMLYHPGPLGCITIYLPFVHIYVCMYILTWRVTYTVITCLREQLPHPPTRRHQGLRHSQEETQIANTPAGLEP